MDPESNIERSDEINAAALFVQNTGKKRPPFLLLEGQP